MISTKNTLLRIRVLYDVEIMQIQLCQVFKSVIRSGAVPLLSSSLLTMDRHHAIRGIALVLVMCTMHVHGQMTAASSGPTREFLAHTMTWDIAKTYCLGIGRRLCRANEICIHEHNGGRKMIDEVLRGDHWTPILDAHNKWMQIGDSRRFTCYSHTETHNMGMATWGNNFSPMIHKAYVYCCGERNAEKRYRYIGKTATYDKAKNHCVNLGKRLCHSSEVCNNNAPVFGAIARDTWVPVNDRRNEWIQIGNTRTCWVHGIHYNSPGWGVRTDGSTRDYVGFVLCC